MSEGMFLTKKTFTEMINHEVRFNGLSHMDAVLHLAEEHNINLEDVRKYISPSIKAKIEAEAQNLNFLPKGNTLPDV